MIKLENDNKETLKVDLGAKGVRYVKMDYPSNSFADKKVEPIHVSEPEKKEELAPKKSNFFEIFFGHTVKDIGKYILFDVLIPAFKDTLGDIIHGSTDMVLKGRSRRASRDSSRVSYDKIISNSRVKYNDTPVRRRANTYEDATFLSRGKAEEVRDILIDIALDTGAVSVADLLSAAHLSSEYTDNNYGWLDLDGVTISRTYEGDYILNLPKPIPISKRRWYSDFKRPDWSNEKKDKSRISYTNMEIKSRDNARRPSNCCILPFSGK